MPGALEGIRVIDMASMWAAPLAAAYLADQGAQVVKIEPLWGDQARRVFTQPPVSGGESRSHLVANRNKLGIALNIACPQGREVVSRMVERSDVLLHNFRPGVAERMGYDYETLRRLNRRLIYVHVTAYGPQGPWAGRRGYDRLFQALGGIMGRRHLPDGTPLGAGVWASDMSAPMAVAYGVALALLTREQTGEGDRVETSLLHMALAMQAVDLVRVEREEHPQEGAPQDFANQAVFTSYRCRDGRWLTIVAVSDGEFRGLCHALEVEHVAHDPRFRTALDRAHHTQELYALLEGLFSTRPHDAWMETLAAHDVPAAPILEPQEVFDSPQVRANAMMVEQEHPQAGRITMVNTPVRLSARPPSTRTPAPLLGQHTDQVLEGLGYPPERIAALRQEGVIK